MDTSSLHKFLEKTHLNGAEVKRRRLTLYFISYIGGIIMAVLAAKNLARDDHYLAFWLGFFSFSVFANAALSHIFKNSNIFYYIAGFIVAVMVAVLTITGGYNNTGLHFVYPIILIQIIIVRFRAAIFYVTGTVGVVAFIVYYQESIPANYRGEDVSRFLISLCSFIAVAFISEYFWHKSRKEMMTDNLERLRQANSDPLTKVPNRRFLESVYFERAMKNPADYFPLSIVVVDIDYFKKINDNYGHDVGDRVLVQVATLMKNAIRATDVVSRTGGEEFLIIYPKTTLSMAVKLAEKIRVEIENSPFIEGDIFHSITASFGVATALTDANINDTVKLADEHLYEAKGAGRNRVM
ncbi:GGDEF domain-containing protein [Alteromonas sp. 38]|uniref:GGDEF domain-containing protein n=1 Tax=Alteromonas TaxID=226 RepID=UPI0012EF628E|nr:MULTISPECIES: GGDEF domain-containing protein [Alteromonas]CAD5255759.1 GGDEF domain-containing protein [Alteromonas sp. 154]VXA97220.1 GGDEF domain-containing protein [Alteromonas sp. 38]